MARTKAKSAGAQPSAAAAKTAAPAAAKATQAQPTADKAAPTTKAAPKTSAKVDGGAVTAASSAARTPRRAPDKTALNDKSTPKPIPGPGGAAAVKASLGAPAPAFDMPDAAGGRASLRGLKGTTVILYFYPKDDTIGCTREALDFSNHTGDFEALGAIVIGVSKDSPESHRRFSAKHGLTVRLASDADGAVCESYGVWVQKSLYGRTYFGIERATFWIDPSGMVRQIWRRVRPAGHAASVLEALREAGGRT
jgi:thioredoxin-dependent peroxiredoxin